MRHSARFQQFEPAERPAHIPASRNHRILDQGFRMCQELEPLVPPSWAPPWHPSVAAQHLVVWTKGLGAVILESSWPSAEIFEARLMEADQVMIDDMNQWLAGRWSSRSGLVELIWRIEAGERCVAAALWLHDVAKGSGEIPARNRM